MESYLKKKTKTYLTQDELKTILRFIKKKGSNMIFENHKFTQIKSTAFFGNSEDFSISVMNFRQEPC